MTLIVDSFFYYPQNYRLNRLCHSQRNILTCSHQSSGYLSLSRPFKVQAPFVCARLLGYASI